MKNNNIQQKYHAKTCFYELYIEIWSSRFDMLNILNSVLDLNKSIKDGNSLPFLQTYLSCTHSEFRDLGIGRCQICLRL